MIDIHSHMLPGVDDGSPSLAVTKNILARYVEEGVDKVICTPHQNSALLRPALLKERFAELQGNVAEFPVGLYLGAELYYCENIVDLLASGRFLTLAGTKYVLVEFSTRHEMVYIPDAVYELSVAGYVPIVAHIERYPYFPLKQWAEVRENGGLIQLNASCFAKKENLGLAKKALKGGEGGLLHEPREMPVLGGLPGQPLKGGVQMQVSRVNVPHDVHALPRRNGMEGEAKL